MDAPKYFYALNLLKLGSNWAQTGLKPGSSQAQAGLNLRCNLSLIQITYLFEEQHSRMAARKRKAVIWKKLIER